jgi:SAM-dependent methyltransferase
VAPFAETTEVYDAFAPIYDAVGGPRFAMLCAQRLDALVALRLPQLITGGPAAGAAPGTLAAQRLSFLDVGCGTGTLLCALREAHPDWRLAGVDGSPSMLGRARGKPGHESILWLRAMLPAPLPFGDDFHVVGSFYDTLNHLPDLDALAATFRTVASVLRPGGLFAFDLTSPFGYAELWRHRLDFRAGEYVVRSELDYDPGTHTGSAAVSIAHQGTERSFVLHQRCFAEADVEMALIDAGFTPDVVAPWSPIKKNSPSKLWFVATKDKNRLSRP